jgi:hypothetical protein
MGNFIDKTFTVIADILLKVLPASKQEKQAFSYYRAGSVRSGQRSIRRSITKLL